MKTDYEIVHDLRTYWCQQAEAKNITFGITNAEQSKKLRDAISEHTTEVQLRNLRNYLVLFISIKHDLVDYDFMSALCTIIDSKLISLGAEV